MVTRKNGTAKRGQSPKVVDFNEISEVGTYVATRTGFLLRIPYSAIAEGRAPVLTIENASGVPCLKLSGYPNLPLSKARKLAANYDIAVRF